MDQFCEGASLSIGELADDQLKPTGREVLTLTILIYEVSQFHYLRKSSRWKSKKNQPPEVWFYAFSFKRCLTMSHCLTLQSWFEKSLDACVLEGDAECQVSISCLIGIVLYQILGCQFWHIL